MLSHHPPAAHPPRHSPTKTPTKTSTHHPPAHPPTHPPTLPACPCQVFNALNSLELKSLEEPRYLLQQFARAPLACLTLASFVATNTGDVARKCIQVRRVGEGLFGWVGL